MNQITQTLPPKEVIAYYNKQFVVPLLQDNGFAFKERTLEYHRNTKDFKQVIWHRCDKNNLTGIYIGFEMGYSIYAQNLKHGTKRSMGKTLLAVTLFLAIGSSHLVTNGTVNTTNTLAYLATT